MSSAIGTIIGIIFLLVIVAVVWWAIQQLLPTIPLGEPFRTIIYVLTVVVMVLIVLWVIMILLGIAGIRVPSPFSRGEVPGGAFAAVTTWTTKYL